MLTFTGPTGAAISGSDWFVEVLAGKDANSLTSLTPTLALNRTGAGAGFANPFSAVVEQDVGRAGYRVPASRHSLIAQVDFSGILRDMSG